MPVLAVATVVVGLDQLTKALITAWLGPAAASHRFHIIEPVVALRYARNSGAAFGIFGDQGLLLVLVAAVIIGALLIVTLSGSVASSWQQRTVGLIVGGAAGNLIDRLRLGYVTDFIDIGPWPTFNLADTAITIGIAVIVIHGFASEPRPGRKINGDRAQ